MEGDLREPKPTLSDIVLKHTFLIFIPKFVTPNHLTIIRLLSVPFFIVASLYNQHFLALIVFSLSAFTDALDGAIARTRNLVSDAGKFLDPLADKLLVGSAILVLAGEHVNYGIAASIIILELILIAKVTYLREIKREVVSAMWSGKIKMILVSFALVGALLNTAVNLEWLSQISNILFYLSIIFALISVFIYRSI
jgi:CDP-diacylglycerol--glycerol-3-phosphate 3-phosphatidyltransferase